MEVAVEGEEDLIVVGDELVPEHQSVLSLAGAFAVSCDVEYLVTGENHRKRRMLSHYGIGPREGGIRDAPGEREHHELLPLSLEDVVAAEPGRVAA